MLNAIHVFYPVKVYIKEEELRLNEHSSLLPPPSILLRRQYWFAAHTTHSIMLQYENDNTTLEHWAIRESAEQGPFVWHEHFNTDIEFKQHRSNAHVCILILWGGNHFCYSAHIVNNTLRIVWSLFFSFNPGKDTHFSFFPYFLSCIWTYYSDVFLSLQVSELKRDFSIHSPIFHQINKIVYNSYDS